MTSALVAGIMMMGNCDPSECVVEAADYRSPALVLPEIHIRHTTLSHRAMLKVPCPITKGFDAWTEALERAVKTAFPQHHEDAGIVRGLCNWVGEGVPDLAGVA